jgi:alpha-tubulin suppressor-like RCC1 family protein
LFEINSMKSRFSAVVLVAALAPVASALAQGGQAVGWGNSGIVPPASLLKYTQVACGGYHTYALQNDGTLVGWGAGGPGQTGDPNYGQTNTPAGLANVKQVACGYVHTYALKNDGTLVGWGGNG